MKTRRFADLALLLSLLPLVWSSVIVGKEKAPSPAANAEAHGDWALQCPEAGPCFLIQRVFLKGKEEQSLINLVLQFSGKPSRLLFGIRTPLGVMLTPGLKLGVDQAEADTYPYHHCRPEGCFAVFPVSGKLRRSLKRGKRAHVTYFLLNGKTHRIPVSLVGITAGLQALRRTGP